MDKELISTLQGYWFSEKEAKIYLTALSLWAAPASTIARNLWENRTTIYDILWELVTKWMFSKIIRGNVAYFSPLDPEIFIKQCEKRVETLKNKLHEINSFSSLLKWSWNFKVFEWKNWLRNMFLELSTTTNPKFFQWNIDFIKLWDNYPEQELQYYKSIIEEKWMTFYRILSNESRLNQTYEAERDNQQSYKRETIIAPDLYLDTKACIFVYWPNKTIILTFEDRYPYILKIENEHLYHYLDSLFNFVWHSKTNQKID